MNNKKSPNTDSQWKPLYKAGAASAFIIAVFIPIQGIIYALWKPPETVSEWFVLFQKNKLIGLLDMDLLLTVDYILFIIVFLALWAVLKQTNQSLATLAVIFEIAGVAAYFSSTAAFEMLKLSNLYASAASETGRSMYLAAGEAMYATWQGTAFNVSYFLGFIALVTISLVMLKSKVFNKTTSYLGLTAGVLMAVPPTVGMFGIIMSFLSLIPTLPWLILVSSRLSRLAKYDTYLSS